jgi:uncharacterized protein with HEPN domain
MRHSAVIREFQIIGEAVGKLGDSIKKAYPHIAWQDIKKTNTSSLGVE